MKIEVPSNKNEPTVPRIDTSPTKIEQKNDLFLIKTVQEKEERI